MYLSEVKFTFVPLGPLLMIGVLCSDLQPLLCLYRAEAIKKANGTHFPEEVALTLLHCFFLVKHLASKLVIFLATHLASKFVIYSEFESFLLSFHLSVSRCSVNGLYSSSWRLIICIQITFFIVM